VSSEILDFKSKQYGGHDRAKRRTLKDLLASQMHVINPDGHIVYWSEEKLGRAGTCVELTHLTSRCATIIEGQTITRVFISFHAITAGRNRYRDKDCQSPTPAAFPRSNWGSLRAMSSMCGVAVAVELTAG